MLMLRKPGLVTIVTAAAVAGLVFAAGPTRSQQAQYSYPPLSFVPRSILSSEIQRRFRLCLSVCRSPQPRSASQYFGARTASGCQRLDDL